MTMLKTVALAVAASLSMATTVFAQTPAPDGQKLFMQCRACHAIEAGKPNGVGPNLRGIVGRKAGTVAGFAYSPAMKAHGKVWDDAALDAYLANPRTYIPNNKMAFPGLKKPEQRAAIIAYLKTQK